MNTKDKVKFIASSENILYYITDKGELWSLGFGSPGRLGYNYPKTRSQTASLHPRRIYSNSKKQPRFQSIFPGSDYVFILDESNYVWLFGNHTNFRQLSRFEPLELYQIKDIASYQENALFLSLNGKQLYHSQNVLKDDLKLITHIPQFKSIYYSNAGAYGIDENHAHWDLVNKSSAQIGSILTTSGEQLTGLSLLNFQSCSKYCLFWAQEKDDL